MKKYVAVALGILNAIGLASGDDTDTVVVGADCAYIHPSAMAALDVEEKFP